MKSEVLRHHMNSKLSIHGHAKKIIWGTNSQGTTQKICRPPLAAGKFFRQPRRPGVENGLNFFTHGIPMGYSRGSFTSTFLPGLTPQGSFSRFFLSFSEFSWFFQFFLIFPPLGSCPLPEFFLPMEQRLPRGCIRPPFITHGSRPKKLFHPG